MSCPRCGSWSVRRDRSLAGRMVCGQCSMPLSPGQSSAIRRPGRGLPRPGWPTRPQALWRWLLPIGLLLLVSAHLAQRSLRQERGGAPSAGLIR